MCHTKFGPQFGPYVRRGSLSVCLSVSEAGEKNLEQLASHHCFVRALSSLCCSAMVAHGVVTHNLSMLELKLKPRPASFVCGLR